MNVDLRHVARELNQPFEHIQRTVQLLDEGNTVPFVTRYRKDQTGGLDEEQIRRIQSDVARLRMLADRKATILKSIESQGKLTPELADEIEKTLSAKRLEDLYLPYKPKKQTLATIARDRGLEPLAQEVLDASSDDLEARAAEFISAEKGLESVADVLTGVRHILAERFSEEAELRGRLRKIMRNSGKLTSTRIEPAPVSEAEQTPDANSAAAEPPAARPASDDNAPAPGERASAELVTAESESVASAEQAVAGSEASAAAATGELPASAPVENIPVENIASENDAANLSAAANTATGETAAGESATEPPAAVGASADSPAGQSAGDASASVAAGLAAAHAPAAGKTMSAAANKKRKKKDKEKRDKLEAAYKDYFNYSEQVSRIPPHRVLAINRGERAKILRVRIESDTDALYRQAEQSLAPDSHRHAEFLRTCVRDALARLVLPSLEREIRRELTEKAEQHAVHVFARNLRKLLLQPPVHGRRVLAIDPGFKSGCKYAALDEFGNVLGSGVFHIVGAEDRRKKGRERLVAAVKEFNLSVIAIGNGTACRETEQLAAEIIAGELQDRDVAYVVANEAGASVYSTSSVGREELPQFDPVVRSAVSIGRRLLDPLSELVKINPANIGVGMYQHDVKAKHLRDSLDAVVESCVNYVGVDVNTASPALLRYVSGLNQLTARRLYDYRREHGPFKSREQLNDVPGFGESAFIQSAGFLKIVDGDNPLDGTWIHPESYEVARRVLEKLGSSVEELARGVRKTARRSAPLAAVMTKRTEAESSAAPLAAGESTPTAVDADAAPLSAVDTGAIETPSDEGASATGAPESAPSVGVEGPPSSAEPTLLQSPAAQEGEGAVSADVASLPDADDKSSSAEANTTGIAEDRQFSAGSAVSAPHSLPIQQSPAPGTNGAAAVLEPLAKRAAEINVDEAAGELGIGALLLNDILTGLTRPGRDPREDLPRPVFRRGIMKLEDLEPGMELSGTVLNVVDFGAFVDIGLSDSGLIHISRLADRYIRDPHEVVGVGDVLKVWVVEVDKQRRRVSLTAIKPGAEKPVRPRREKPARKPPAKAQQPTQQDGRRSDRGSKRVGPPKQRQTTFRPKPKPKVVTPITKAMAEGKEPLRSFSDLMQFMEKKQDDDSASQDGKA